MLKQAHILYILTCHLKTDADPGQVPDPAYHYDADADVDSVLFLFDADPEFSLMRPQY